MWHSHFCDYSKNSLATTISSQKRSGDKCPKIITITLSVCKISIIFHFRDSLKSHLHRLDVVDVTLHNKPVQIP